MRGPWYTLKDAEDILSFKRAELLYHIDIGAIQAVVHTNSRAFLIYKNDDKQRRKGIATCMYRGCLLIHSNNVAHLLEGNEITLGKQGSRILEPNNVLKWNSTYPFSQAPSFCNMHGWEPESWHDINIAKFGATPLPKEGPTILGAIASLMAAKDSISPNSHLALDYESNSLFKPEDIRIPASEIELFSAPKTPELKALKRNKEIDSAPKLNGKRTNQLHELMFRALLANPSSGTKELWFLIKNDWESDSPQYDQEQIITAMDATCIDWRSRNYVEQAMKRTSFGPVLSKLKKQL
ncbi:MAG: hypothetical protein V7752_03705 [Halopseudomonas sp.]